MTTPQKIINLLNRKESTISELAAQLNISRNSVHQQISRLEAAGAVEKFHRDQPVGAGKPAFYYRAAAGHEDEFSLAYKPILSQLIATLCTDLAEQDRIALFENTGRSLARAAGLAPSEDFYADTRKSVDAVNALGAMAELTVEKQHASVSCHSCPVATLVHTDPMVCRLVASFFSAATGRQVAVHCRRQGTVVCGFEFSEC